MSDRDQRHPDDERIAKGVRELPHAGADSAFQSRLRQAFVDGNIQPAAPEGQATRRAPRRSLVARWLVPALAAAAVALVLINRPPALRVIAVSGTGYVMVNGEPVSLADSSLIRSRVRSGIKIELPEDAVVDVLADGVMLIEAAPGTRMTLPRVPGHWFQRAVSCSLMAGEIRLKTGPAFHGATLRVHTPHGIAEVTGTMISVQCDANGTCVCVLEGTARVGVNDADLEAVAPEFRKVMHGDGRTEIIPIAGVHRDGLVEFDLRVGGRMGSRD